MSHNYETDKPTHQRPYEFSSDPPHIEVHALTTGFLSDWLGGTDPLQCYQMVMTMMMMMPMMMMMMMMFMFLISELGTYLLTASQLHGVALNKCRLSKCMEWP